jgi:hypothetical protein
MNELQNILSQLRVIDDRATSGTISTLFVEITTGDGETVISANREGLIHLALQLVSLADSKTGSHFHLDEVSIADFAQTNVVFAHKETT